MPKLTKHHFVVQIPGADNVGFETQIYVETSGTFSCDVTEELANICSSMVTQPGTPYSGKGARQLGRERGYYVDTPRDKWRAYAPSLNELKAFVRTAIEELHRAEVHEELVIRYDWAAEVAMFVGPDDKLYPNGRDAERAAGTGGRWMDGKAMGNAQVGQIFHSSNPVTGYRVGLFAAVYLKTTWTRASGVRTAYQRIYQNADHLGEQLTWGRQLCQFCSMSEPRYLNEMPYSEEAARFFCGALMTMGELGRRFLDFFRDPAQMQQLINTPGVLLLGNRS